MERSLVTKLMSLLGMVSLVASLVASLSACGTKTTTGSGDAAVDAALLAPDVYEDDWSCPVARVNASEVGPQVYDGGGFASSACPNVAFWLTTADKTSLLTRQPNLELRSKNTFSDFDIRIDESTEMQEIDGFGAAVTDSAAWVLHQHLSTSSRNEVLQRLFNRETGAGFSYLRIPVGASDFARTHYSYDDVPPGEEDPDLARFSIDPDRAYILPILKEILAINPDVKFMASPWSAPGWMKTTDSLIGGKLEASSHEVFARYYVRFLRAYEAEGIRFDTLTLQNEPHHQPSNYPGMYMDSVQQAAIIKSHLGPALAEAGLTTKIVVWDHNWDNAQYAISVLNDGDARSFIAGSAFHCYAGNVSAQSKVHDAHPDKALYFTECSGGGWATSFSANLQWNINQLVVGATRNWARTVLLWNLALDENSGPHLGGCDNCRGVVTVRAADGTVVYNEEYYALAHGSKFVKSGARRIGSTEGLRNVVFKNPDGTRAMIVLNNLGTRKFVRIETQDSGFQAELAAGAVATFVW